MFAGGENSGKDCDYLENDGERNELKRILRWRKFALGKTVIFYHMNVKPFC
jgi:hypothetical protein